MKKRNGRFPETRDMVEEISMMGQYITNAYELFILNRPAALLDVNMARVLERYFGSRKLSDIRYDPYLQELSKQIVQHQKLKEINWAILDIGAIMCKKNIPKCSECLIKTKCSYYNSI
jgi:A/G-specific adenine glycosylase